MEYIIIGIFILLVFIIYKQRSLKENFIVPMPSTEYDLKGQTDNNGKFERSFGKSLNYGEKKYDEISVSKDNECNVINEGCICGNYCNSNNYVEPRWKWNQRWIERSKLEMKKEIQNGFEQKQCCL